MTKSFKIFAVVALLLSALSAQAGSTRELRTNVKINASPEKVWSVLMDFDRHANWNPFIKSISGDKREGGTLAITVQAPGKDPMDFDPTVLVFKENKELRWKGKFLFEGLFDGEHFFILTGNQDGTTTLEHGENFSGFLVQFFGGDLDKTEKGFHLMNQALKAECEK